MAQEEDPPVSTSEMRLFEAGSASVATENRASTDLSSSGEPDHPPSNIDGLEQGGVNENGPEGVASSR